MWHGMVVGERLVDWERRVENPSCLQHRTSLAPRHLDTSLRFALRLRVVLNLDVSKCFIPIRAVTALWCGRPETPCFKGLRESAFICDYTRRRRNGRAPCFSLTYRIKPFWSEKYSSGTLGSASRIKASTEKFVTAHFHDS
jgi:hypothetical protein